MPGFMPPAPHTQVYSRGTTAQGDKKQSIFRGSKQVPLRLNLVQAHRYKTGKIEDA